MGINPKKIIYPKKESIFEIKKVDKVFQYMEFKK